LARTPLLLALLCLAFDETLSFPSRRVDLYRDALEALLRKWDSSRLIKRDIIYRNLSPRRKEQLLGRLAAQSFDAGVYFIRQETLAGQIIKYLQELPGFDSFDVLDGDAVLTAIEAQHGILVERAQGIYSFSHLTFQEYLTAKYIVENAAQGTVNRLVSKYMSDSRWNEVFLSVASLLDKADFFFEEFINTIKNSILKEKDVKDIVQWAQRRAKLSKQPNALGRIVYIYSVFYRALCESDEPRLVRTLEYINQVIYEIDPVIAKNARYSVDTALKIKHELRVGHPRYLPMIEERMYARLEDIISSIGGEFKKRDLSITEFVNSNYMNKIDRYLRENILLMECLRLSSVSNREKIVDMILKV
jgi:hypothetical protein